ncbi:ATPase, T2SS/T4P/T4SS family [Halobellus inordinatus]|uniref:ATPase, T2SS/T4P/T4SS family n=1 Tax=Halobellus inordinatus TaxID=1126236 RepID=UPI0021148D51|nr:ATPase, T2SS/T4P/T4SS family [Halobellus ramosii]
MSLNLGSVLGDEPSLSRLTSSLPDVAALGLGSDPDQPNSVNEASGPVASGVDPGETGEGCRCQPSIERPTGTGVADRRELVVDASACPGKGVLESRPGCRATVVAALTDHDVDAVRTRSDGRERTYTDESVGLLLAAGRFVERVRFHDESLAERARRDPLAAARRATGRAGAVARIAAESGLAEGVARAGARLGADDFNSVGDGNDYAGILSAFVGPTIARARVARQPPSDASPRETYELPTGADVWVYDTADGARYHLGPVAHGLDAAATSTLAAAYGVLANGSVSGGPRAAGRAVRRVASPADPVETLSTALDRYTRGLGVFEHLFADERVSDVVVSAPVTDSPVRVVLDGERVPTNLRLTPGGAASLASRFRRESGRAFSRSSPTLDASVVAETGRRIRVAGVTAPASDGVGFAFRARDDEAWTLARLVAAQSLSPAAAAFLSLAIERGAATIVAGTRGAGKTTLLGALLWELPYTTRLVSIEDTPELPVAALRAHGRDVQALHTDGHAGGSGEGAGIGGSFSPTNALRAALRLGDGALAVGEVRGEEAGALYEAMRVGAHGHAVLGTIHGDSAAAVRERVVSDLGVPPSSFGATDLVVTCAHDGDARYVDAIEEVRAVDGDTTFVSLFERQSGTLRRTGSLDRGDSALFERLCHGDESYGDLLSLLDRRASRFERLATAGLTAPDDLRPSQRGGR